MTMTKAEVVQAASNLHRQVGKAIKVIAKGVFKNTTTFDTANDIFNRDTRPGNNRVDETVTQV